MRRLLSNLKALWWGVLLLVTVLLAPTGRCGEPKEEIEWTPPRFPERQAERDAMVDHLHRTYPNPRVSDEKVLDAMRHIPRHLFVPDGQSRRAYADVPLPIGSGQTISQPYIVGLMTQLLDLEAGEKVLEIGTGSGYQAAALTEITPHVWTIEIFKGLGERAANRLMRLGYTTVEAKIADGYYGWEDEAPFDAIIVTAASDEIPPPLLQQLANGGRMVIPVGAAFSGQTLVLITKDERGRTSSRNIIPVIFVPFLRGEARD